TAHPAGRAHPRPPPRPPQYRWAGCWGAAGVGGVGGFHRHSSFSISEPTGHNSLDTDGGLFGGQLGCRYQFAGWSPWAGSNWVVGVQGDFAGAAIDGKGIFPNSSEDKDDIVSVHTKWIASVTGSLGVTA